MNKITDAVAATLQAATRLGPTPGYINGDEYSQWYVEAPPSLLLALAELARDQGEHQLADRLDRLSHPLCMEPLDAVLPTGAMPKKWCFNAVETAGEPCEMHTPERAADLGRCTWSGSSDGRICRSTPRPGDDRCEHHAVYCRAVKTDGAVCNRPGCTVPKHRRATLSAVR